MPRKPPEEWGEWETSCCEPKIVDFSVAGLGRESRTAFGYCAPVYLLTAGYKRRFLNMVTDRSDPITPPVIGCGKIIAVCQTASSGDG
jgi:hypothetical protein